MKTLQLMYRADKCNIINKTIESINKNAVIKAVINSNEVDLTLIYDESAFKSSELLQIGVLIGQTIALK